MLLRQSPCVLAPVSPGCQWSFPIQSSGDTYPLGMLVAGADLRLAGLYDKPHILALLRISPRNSPNTAGDCGTLFAPHQSAPEPSSTVAMRVGPAEAGWQLTRQK